MRCPGCGRYYCRECASEHDGRYLCLSCLKAATPDDTPRRNVLRPLGKTAALLVALYVLWQSFFNAGYLLLQVPSESHDAAVQPWEDVL